MNIIEQMKKYSFTALIRGGVNTPKPSRLHHIWIWMHNAAHQDAFHVPYAKISSAGEQFLYCSSYCSIV